MPPAEITSSGMAMSGSTSSGSFQAPLPVDYGTYRYYSGSFVRDGITYGNSLYPDSLGFVSLDLKDVRIYAYDEYMNLLKAKQGTFKALSAPANGLIAEYLLNGNANDTSGNGRNGTNMNTAWSGTNFNGQNQSAVFNGSNSYSVL